MVVDFQGMCIEDLKLEKVEPLPEHISLDFRHAVMFASIALPICVTLHCTNGKLLKDICKVRMCHCFVLPAE